MFTGEYDRQVIRAGLLSGAIMFPLYVVLYTAGITIHPVTWFLISMAVTLAIGWALVQREIGK